MECPKCASPTRVLETRDGSRKRQCPNGHRFWTEELFTRMANSTDQGPRTLKVKPYDWSAFKITQEKS